MVVWQPARAALGVGVTAAAANDPGEVFAEERAEDHEGGADHREVGFDDAEGGGGGDVVAGVGGGEEFGDVGDADCADDAGSVIGADVVSAV